MKEKFADVSSGKVSGSHIKNLPQRTIRSASYIRGSGLYKIDIDGLDFDIAFFKKPRAAAGTPLFIFFSGFVHRGQTPLPAFQRWSWHNKFPGHTLYISDPMLKETADLGLGWYIGSRTRDINLDICRIVKSVAKNLKTPLSNVVFYGSSGGGFAALRALIEMPEAQAITINPQTLLTNFEGTSLQSYLNSFFEKMSKTDFSIQHSFRNSVVTRSALLRDSRIIYVQNTLDRHHMEKHFSQLFSQDNGDWVTPYFKNYELVFFEDDRGHSIGEPPDLVPCLLDHLTFTS